MPDTDGEDGDDEADGIKRPRINTPGILDDTPDGADPDTPIDSFDPVDPQADDEQGPGVPGEEPVAARDAWSDINVTRRKDAASGVKKTRQFLKAPLTGNYIFTIGLGGRGKSTFQRHLLWYLEKGLELNPLAQVENWRVGPEHRVELDGADAAALKDFARLRLLWAEQFRKKEFPTATSAKIAPTRFSLVATPMGALKGSKPLKFGFFEIAGELFQLVLDGVKKGRSENLHPDLDDFLANSKCNITFVLLANGKKVREDDDAFYAFMRYLGKFNRSREFRQRCSIALVISYPEAANERMLRQLAAARLGLDDNDRAPETQRQIADEVELEAERHSDEKLANLFVKTYFNQTYAEIEQWRTASASGQARAKVFIFSIGDVEDVEVDGRMVTKIRKFGFEDAQRFYFWLYERFTGTSLGSLPGEEMRAATWRVWLLEALGLSRHR